MSIHTCPEGLLLIDNVAEALRCQCELPAQPDSPEEIALEMDIARAVSAANHKATEHFLRCPICRTG